MTGSTLPVVLVEVDTDSRLRILRHEGVCIALLDRRVDPKVVILPEQHQPLELEEAIRDIEIVTATHDDLAHTAAETIRRLEAREIVVAAISKETANA